MAVACDTARLSRLDVPSHVPARTRLPRRRRVLLLVVVNLITFTRTPHRRSGISSVLEPSILDSLRPADDRLRSDRGREEVVAEHDLSRRRIRVPPHVPHQCHGISCPTRTRGCRPSLSHRFRGRLFTEAMQVPYDSTFCARLERLLNQGAPSPIEGLRELWRFRHRPLRLLASHHPRCPSGESPRCPGPVHLPGERFPGFTPG